MIIIIERTQKVEREREERDVFLRQRGPGSIDADGRYVCALGRLLEGLDALNQFTWRNGSLEFQRKPDGELTSQDEYIYIGRKFKV